MKKEEVYVLSASTPIGDSIVGVYRSIEAAREASNEFLRLAKEEVKRPFGSEDMGEDFDESYEQFLGEKELFSGVNKTNIEKFNLC